MKKMNCHLCEYVFHPADTPIKECKTDDLSCGHPRFDGAAPISAVTRCPKVKR